MVCPPCNSHLFVLLVVAIVSSLSSTSYATSRFPLPNPSSEFLNAHNQARAAVGVDPLQWSPMLANLTSRLVRYQRDKMGCKFANLTSGKYGANQLWTGGQTMSPRDAVQQWVNEKPFYNHTDNTCGTDHHCGVYTQVVWNTSHELGCAQAICVKDTTTLTICFYNPPGNIIGQAPY